MEFLGRSLLFCRLLEITRKSNTILKDVFLSYYMLNIITLSILIYSNIQNMPFCAGELFHHCCWAQLIERNPVDECSFRILFYFFTRSNLTGSAISNSALRSRPP